MKKITFSALFLVLISAAAFAQSKSSLARMKAVENNLIPFVSVKGFNSWTLAERMKFYKVPGVSIAVIKDYKIDWAKGYGFADTLKRHKVTTQTMFSAGSISKFVMAAGALKLVENGKLTLDDPINNYLRSWKVKDNEWLIKKPITLRMLLSHTAGTSQTSYFGFTPDKKSFPSIVEILNGDPIAESRSVVVNSEPGKDFRYSGGGSMIAQMAIMDVSGQDFAIFCNQTIFKPLAMKHTTFEQPLPQKFEKVLSWGYSEASWFKGMPYVYPQQAAAGLYATPTDLAQFFIAIQKSYKNKGNFLNNSLAKLMLSPQAPVSDGSYKEEIGIGPFLIQRTDNKSEDGKYFEFTGVNAGFLAYGIASFQNGNGVVIMLNSGDDVNGLGKEIRRSVAKTYHWTNFLPEEINPVAISESELELLCGRYKAGPDEVVCLHREKNYLVENINGGNAIYCFPIAKDSIIFTDYNVKGFFKRTADGRAISLQTAFQNQPMSRMGDEEFTPSECLKAKKYVEAKAGFEAMKMNEYQITYLAYEWLNKKPADLQAAKTILELAAEQHPDSAIVYNRWGDYYLQINDVPNAILNYKKVLAIEPDNAQINETINQLLKP
ncbi:MAG: serine hydrolase [Burkholderiales bacterium]|nr:serine hydrolase [Flavobacterium sp.]